MMKPAAFGLAAGLALGFSSACLADDMAVDQRFTDTGVAFELKGAVSNVTLTVSAVLWRKRHPRDQPTPAGNRRERPGLFGNEARREGARGDKPLSAAVDGMHSRDQTRPLAFNRRLHLRAGARA
jgi:hypothetical protein